MTQLLEVPHCARCGEEVDVLAASDALEGSGAPRWVVDGFVLFAVIAGMVGKVYCAKCAAVRRKEEGIPSGEDA